MAFKRIEQSLREPSVRELGRTAYLRVKGKNFFFSSAVIARSLAWPDQPLIVEVDSANHKLRLRTADNNMRPDQYIIVKRCGREDFRKNPKLYFRSQLVADTLSVQPPDKLLHLPLCDSKVSDDGKKIQADFSYARKDVW
jgi:hypothetical protein